MSELTRKLALDIVEAARSRKAEDIRVIEVKAVADYADYLVLCSGRSDRQVGAIAEAVEDALSASGTEPIGVEGKRAGRWVLLDYGDVVVHVFHEETRQVYDLERLWYDAPKLELPPDPAAVTSPVAVAQGL